MKKSKWELFLQGWKATLKYLHHHPVQGRILFVGISISMILCSFRSISDDLLKIIEIIK